MLMFGHEWKTWAGQSAYHIRNHLFFLSIRLRRFLIYILPIYRICFPYCKSSEKLALQKINERERGSHLYIHFDSELSFKWNGEFFSFNWLLILSYFSSYGCSKMFVLTTWDKSLWTFVNRFVNKEFVTCDKPGRDTKHWLWSFKP